jgi:hypothetical protein
LRFHLPAYLSRVVKAPDSETRWSSRFGRCLLLVVDQRTIDPLFSDHRFPT